MHYKRDEHFFNKYRRTLLLKILAINPKLICSCQKLNELDSTLFLPHEIWTKCARTIENFDRMLLIEN